MYISYIVAGLLILLMIWGGRFSGFREFHEDHFALENTKSLRGLAALGVIVHHISQREFYQDAGELHSFVNAGFLFVAVFMLGDHTTMPSKFVAGIFAGFLCGLFTMILREKAAPDVYLLCPVLIVNFLSFVLDFFSKTYSRRNKGGVDR